MRTLHHLLRGTGRRRAADYIAAVEAERDQALADAAALRERLGHADALLIDLCCANDRLTRERDRALADVTLLADSHIAVTDENDELAHRLIEARAEIANLRAIFSPAPADCGPAIPLPCDPNTRKVSTLWDANGLRAA